MLGGGFGAEGGLRTRGALLAVAPLVLAGTRLLLAGSMSPSAFGPLWLRRLLHPCLFCVAFDEAPCCKIYLIVLASADGVSATLTVGRTGNHTCALDHTN